MFNGKKELLDKIRLREDSYLEVKEVRFAGRRVAAPHRDSLADSVAAFANTRGGVLVLGIEAGTHDVVGIPLDRIEAVTDFVREVCIDSIEPPVEQLAVEHLRLPADTGEEFPVVKIDVPRSLFVHRSPGGYLHRLANFRRQMSTQHLARLFQKRSQTRLIRFEEQVVSRARLDDLSPHLWKRFRTARSGDDREAFLGKLRMAQVDEGGMWRPTVAGVLMASEDPRRWLPNAFVQAVAYRGNRTRAHPGTTYQLDAADLTGPLDRQVIETCRFVARNMRIAAFKDQGRIDRPQFDMTAVFEAVLNAVVHRDYSVYGSKVRLRLFENQLELYSPGTIANSMTIESLPFMQSARNEALCSLLTKCPAPDEPWLRMDRRTLMEKRGEGVPVILDNSERLSGRTPEYRLIGEAELLLTIHAAGGDENGVEP